MDTIDQTKNKITMIGQSAEIKKILDLIHKVAVSDSTVLISGESGTGKEVVAKAIHAQSLRAEKPFIPINCGAIPEALLESELFGHEKGAFTGAINTRPGRFELAQGGTLFFDEIGEMPYPLQVKMLRAIQEREFERVGGTKVISVDVRILAATNIDLEQAVLEKKFRNDLFYRLNVIPMTLPPLRERKEDIPLLVAHFIAKFNERKQKTITGVSEEARDFLMAYPWPGNIRELENIVERMIVFKDEGVIEVEDLPEKIMETRQAPIAPFRNEPIVLPVNGHAVLQKPEMVEPMADFPPEGVSLPKLVEEFENRLIRQALIRARGVKSQAALLLGLNRTTLVEKMKRRGIEESLPESKKQENAENVMMEENAIEVPQGAP